MVFLLNFTNRVSALICIISLIYRRALDLYIVAPLQLFALQWETCMQDEQLIRLCSQFYLMSAVWIQQLLARCSSNSEVNRRGRQRGRSEGRRKWDNVERNRGGKEVGGEGTEKMKQWGRGRGKWWNTMGPRRLRGREGERKWTGAGWWWWDEKKQEDEQRDISFENYYYYFLLYFVCWCCPVSAQIWLIK